MFLYFIPQDSFRCAYSNRPVGQARKDATYKFALLRANVQCVTEKCAQKRIDENPFVREAGAGYGQGAPSTRKQALQDDETGRKHIHQKTGNMHYQPQLQQSSPKLEVTVAG